MAAPACVAEAGASLGWPPNRVKQWRVEDIDKTPSRSDQVSDEEERTDRFLACELARSLARDLLSGNDAGDETSSSVQVLASYLIQLFYMHRSLRQVSKKEVAVAALFLACKVADVPRRTKDVMRVFTQQGIDRSEPELREDEQKEMLKRILKIEFLLLRIVQFDFDLVVPLTVVDRKTLQDKNIDGGHITGIEDMHKSIKVDRLAEGLLTRLAENQAFQDKCTTSRPLDEAKALKTKVLAYTQNFLADAFMGMAPVVIAPRVVAASALVMAVRYCRREMTPQEVGKLLIEEDTNMTQADLELGIAEIFRVYKIKKKLEKPKQEAKAEAGGTTASPKKRPASQDHPEAPAQRQSATGVGN